MATEIGDLNVIQDEDTLRRMWQQTEDFGRKKEIRLRMYRLREERLKSYYITRESTNSTVTDHKTSTTSHAESLSDQGFLTMKTKEIRDSASPTLDLKQSAPQLMQICSSSSTNTANADHQHQQSSRIEEDIKSSYSRQEINRQQEYENANFQKSSHYASTSEWEPSSYDLEYENNKLNKNIVVDAQTNAAETEQQNIRGEKMLTISHSSRENYDPKTTDSPSSIRYENTVSRSEYSSENRVTEPTQKLIPIQDNRTSITADNIEERMRNDISESKCESKSTNTLEINRNSTSSVDVANVDNSIMNELHKLDSYLSKEAISVPSAHSSPRPRTPDRDIISSAKNEADYATTYQQAYTNKISQDISLTHNAFASSLRASPTLSGKRSSSERSSPEKSTRVSPEKYPTYTTTNDSSRNVRVRNRASTSECDSDDSSATYNKKMGKKVTSSISIATKRTEKVESTVRRHHHQQQHRETEFSSEGSVERETKKYAKSPKSSPERSAFKPVKMATSETHDFQAEVRRQSFPQTPVVVSDKTQKRRIHADERSYSENISNVRSSYKKSPESDVTKTNHTKTTETNKTRTSPQRGSRGVVTPAKSARVVSPAKMADKTEYTASYTSPSLSPSPPPRSRIQSPQKIPYDYTSIRPQSQPQSYKSSPVAPSNETFITSTKIEPQYRAVSQTTASSPSSNVTLMQNNKSKKSASTESHKATTTPSKTIRKSATSPPKTNGVVKKSSKPKQSKEESQSESSETESSSSENSDAEENQVTIEEITESATASTLDDLIESDDRIQQKLKSVDEFDLIKEEKTTPLANTTKAANEEFLKQERIVKEGEIDGSIPPPEVVLGKEAAKLLIDSFAPKEREQAQKNANSKESNIQVKQKSSEGKFVKKQQSNRVMSATSESIDDKEKPTTKKNVVTLDKQQTSTKKSGTLQDDNFLKKEIISKKQIEKKSSKSNLKKATTTSEKAPRLMVTNIGRLNNKSAAAATTSITTKASMTNPKNYQQQQQRTPKRIDSKNALKESSNETISRSNPDKVGKINETKIFKKYKSDKDVYKKQSETNKKYRRTESDKPLKADKVKTPLTIQNQNKTSSRSLNGYEKSSLSSRNKQINAQHGETIKENVSKSKTNYDRKETPSKNIGTVKILKSNTKNVKTQETAVKPKTLLFSSSTNHSTTKSSVPGYAMPRKTTTTRTKSDETAITKQSRTNQESNTNNVTTLKRNAFPSSNRTRKDTPKPQQITISVSDRPNVSVSSLSKDKKVKKNSTIKSEIFETTSSSSSSIIDLIDVDAIDGEDAEEKATEVIDVAETISKARDEKPEPRSSVSDSQHLNVIVRMPSSSRETTPKMNEEQFCTVTDEGDSPRYADKVIEPEDVEMVKRITIPRFEKITDLDENEDEEGDETTRNVSVADRVSKFLENASCASDTSKDVHSKQANVVDQVFQNQQTVNKTKEIFESIAKSSKTPAPPPIINRPSIFEHKRLNESIEEEDETVSSATHYGHDGPHKIVSKKLIPQDYQDYVMERQSKHEVESTTHDQNDSNFVTNEKQELEKEITESKKSVHNVGTKSDRENMIDTSMKLESSTHKEGKSDRPKAFSAVECQRYEKKNSHQEIDETSCKSKSPTRAKQHSQHSPTAAEVKPKTKSKESSPTRDYSTTKSNKRVNTLHQSDSISKKEKDDVIRKTIQRYESRKFSDKLSPKPIEITTVEVRPSKRIYDHTAITTVDACQDKYKTSSSDKRELDEEGKSMAKVSSSSKASSPAKETPLRHKTSPSPPRTAQTNDKFITSTKTDDYENRKQFFEAKGRKDSEKHIEHYRNDTTASTLHRKSPERPHTKRLSPEKNVNASRRTTESINTSTTTTREKWSPEKLATPFGVSLKKTVTSSPTQRKTPNTDGLTEEEKKVEEIFDLELLEAMLEKAVRYDLRSRIRAQIRLIRRQMELKKTSRTPSPEKSPTNEAKGANGETIIQIIRHAPSSSDDMRKNRKILLETYPRRTTSSQSKITSKETTQSIIDRRDKVKKRLFADDSSKDKLDGKIREQTPPSDRFTKSENSSKKPVNIVKCKSLARESNIQTTYQKDFGSSVRSKKGETHSTTERIISGYGVGPTDDKGKPLFGLKALRALNDADNKSSTRKDYNDGTVIKRRESHEITDHAGKPLFGLKALQRPSQQSQSYVNTTSSTSSVRHSNSSQDTNDKFNTSNTVYSSRTTMKSDSSGNVSFSRDEVKGEIHAKNGEQPSGTMTRNQVTYEKPRNKEATVRTSSATRTLNGSEEKGHSSRTQDVNSDSDYLNSESRRSSAGDDSWKSKFNSSSLIRRISNQHFEQAQRKFNASQTSTDENRRDSSEKHDSKCKPFSTNQRSSEKSINAQFLRTERNDDEFDEGKTQIGQASSFKDVKSKLQQATVSSSMKQVAKFVDDRQDKESSAKTTAENDFTFKSNNDSKAKSRFEHFDQTSKSTSSFSQHSKLSDNNQSFSSTTSHEAIQRVSATGTSAGQLTDEEKQAVSMLNRFVGGSVSLQELEVMSPTNSDTFSTSVDKFENQNKTNKNSRELDINQICDEEELRNLLEDCTDYEKRRLIRTKLRNIMADRKGCTELVQSDDKAGTNITHNANESNEIAETSSTTITTKSETFSSSVHVHSKTSSTGRIIKANSVTSPFAKFRQLERQNSLPSSGAPIFKFTDPKLTRSASSIKDRLLNWVKAQTKDYKNIQIDNFSTSWNNGLAFCALIHHFCPHAFDYNKLTPEQRRYNFELAFRVAEQEAGIVPLLDVEDMVIMKRPDWKCVFTYVQSVYQRFHASPEANRP